MEQVVTNMNAKKGPVCLIVLGMAGSGKTSLVQKLSSNSEKKPYVVNLDPACLNLPYFANIGKKRNHYFPVHVFVIFSDIRKTIHYKEVMKQYQLGPNGAIVTSLNLFATKFTDAIKFIEKCPNELCILDTPGQIEVFTWSVSGVYVVLHFNSYPNETPRLQGQLLPRPWLRPFRPLYCT